MSLISRICCKYFQLEPGLVGKRNQISKFQWAFERMSHNWCNHQISNSLHLSDTLRKTVRWLDQSYSEGVTKSYKSGLWCNLYVCTAHICSSVPAIFGTLCPCVLYRLKGSWRRSTQNTMIKGKSWTNRTGHWLPWLKNMKRLQKQQKRVKGLICA